MRGRHDFHAQRIRPNVLLPFDVFATRVPSTPGSRTRLRREPNTTPWIETSARATTVHRVYSRSVGPRADSPPQRGESGWNRGTVRLRHRVRGNSRVKKCVSMDAGKRQPRRKPHLLRRHRFPVSSRTALHNNHPVPFRRRATRQRRAERARRGVVALTES